MTQQTCQRESTRRATEQARKKACRLHQRNIKEAADENTKIVQLQLGFQHTKPVVKVDNPAGGTLDRDF